MMKDLLNKIIDLSTQAYDDAKAQAIWDNINKTTIILVSIALVCYITIKLLGKRND